MRKLIAVVLWALPLLGQAGVGELRLTVTDPAGLGLKSTVELLSEGNDYRHSFTTDEQGKLHAQALPFGAYRLKTQAAGFVPVSQAFDVRSAVPADLVVKLAISPVQTTVVVEEPNALVEPSHIGAVNRVSAQTIETRAASLPGRALADLVNSQPGWLYEGNGVLHPRGSEYQAQFVVDGIPLTDKRSLEFAPEIEADDVQSLVIYTANIPAEYGRKMGGVIEVNSQKNSREGLHGTFATSAGSFTTVNGYGLIQYGWRKNSFSFSSNGSTTQRFLNPPVVQNYTNTATTGNFALKYDYDLSKDHLGFMVRRDRAHFLVPNEQVQQASGQRQARANVEAMGAVWYQHTLSQNALAEFRGMVRDSNDALNSNPLSTPMIAGQDRGFREKYGKGTISIHQGRQEWKAGVEADFTSLHETLHYTITNPEQFDPGTPARFDFSAVSLQREEAAFVQDIVQLGNWTISAGARWDHYQLLVNRSAVSPRVAVGRYFPSADLLLHASYDSVFQTPAFENILLSSSPAVAALSPEVLRLPVQPSRGHYFQVGAAKGFKGKLKLDLNYFRRRFDNYADDDQLLNTAISFPIAFHDASIYGAEAKLEMRRWGPFSGFISYSYMVGSASLPAAGGLFLGDDASGALSRNHGRFSITQDQRNTLRTRFHYFVRPRLWLAAGASYGSGLPTEFTGTVPQAVAQYGNQLVEQVDLVRGRLRPSYSLEASTGVDLLQTDKLTMRFQADVENLTNRLNLTNFAGLFSGTTVAPPRSCFLRLQARF